MAYHYPQLNHQGGLGARLLGVCRRHRVRLSLLLSFAEAQVAFLGAPEVAEDGQVGTFERLQELGGRTAEELD